MRDLCNTDKPLFAVLTKLTYSAYLNILWLVCSLPIVTIGASTTALFYVTLKMAEDRDDGLTRMFFKAFRENFKPATKLWLILLAVGSFLAADGFVLRRMWSENIFWTLLTAVLIGAAILYGIVLLYAFPLLARFENTTFGILKTAFLVGVRYLFCTLLMAAIYGIMGYVIVFVFTPAFLLGMGLCAMLCSFLMLRISPRQSHAARSARCRPPYPPAPAAGYCGGASPRSGRGHWRVAGHSPKIPGPASAAWHPANGCGRS